ncbi:hypothetical protein DRN86_05070, partial [Candidatus Geothermarchaeota archaeon]
MVNKEEFNPIEEIKSFLRRNSNGRSGAIFFFIGKVKRKSKSGKLVDKLEIESYREKSDEKLKEICRRIKRKFNVEDSLIVHAEGIFNPGEDLVLVG